MEEGAVEFSVRHPRLVTAAMVAATLLLGAMIPRVHIDTDPPENMLSAGDPVRVFHDRMAQNAEEAGNGEARQWT